MEEKLRPKGDGRRDDRMKDQMLRQEDDLFINKIHRPRGRETDESDQHKKNFMWPWTGGIDLMEKEKGPRREFVI